MEDPNLSRILLPACRKGDLSRVETLVLKHDIQDWTQLRYTSSGNTALHIASREGHLNIVRYLCEKFKKPDFIVNVANRDMRRPVHEAVDFVHSDILKYLIGQGADVNALSLSNWTPLMVACTKTGSEAYKCIVALLEANANPLLRNKDGWTALHFVCQSGDETAFDLLVTKFVECIDVRTNNGRSVLHFAAFHGHEGLVNRLMALSTKLLDSRDSSGSTPLHEAVKGRHIPIMKRLIDLGADMYARDKYHRDMLSVALEINDRELYRVTMSLYYSYVLK